MTPMEKAEPRTLYVSRKLKNADDLIAWAKGQGFAKTVPTDELHVTIAFSRTPVDWMKCGAGWTGQNNNGDIVVEPGGARLVEPLGDKGAIVLLFNSAELSWRNRDIVNAGASWDWPDYQPHVTITYEGAGVDLDKVEPYRGKLVFGPEIFAEVDEDWKDKVTEKRMELIANIVKVDDEQRMVYGWASVISEKGKSYVDSQGDMIDADTLVKATTEFMASARMAKAMHEGNMVGEVLHSFPLVNELAKSLGIESEREGWIVGVKIGDDEVWKSVKDGTFRAFSIGGEGRREAA